MAKFLQVSTTTATRSEAEQLANMLLEQRLVACAQIVGPILSHYWWKGQLETSTEWQCLLKTSAHLYESVELCLQKHHPYDTPEVIALPIEYGSADYLDWLNEQLREPS